MADESSGLVRRARSLGGSRAGTAANAIVRHTQVEACLQRVMSVLFVSQACTVVSGYCAAISALGFLTNSFSTGSLASKTRLKNPTIISSQLCSPHATSLVGSAFSGLFGELSKCAVQAIVVPLGSATGSSRLYQFCQCQS